MSAPAGTIVVHEVRPHDADRLGEALVAAYVADGLVAADDPYVWTLRDVTARLGDVVAVLAAYAGDDVLGGLTLVDPGTPHAEVAEAGEVEVRMLGVAPPHRGRRAAEALLRAAEERGRADGYAALVLSSLEGMSAAQRLYRSYGFLRVPERDWRADWDPQALAAGTAPRLNVFRLPLGKER